MKSKSKRLHTKPKGKTSALHFFFLLLIKAAQPSDFLFAF
jgi:hypothetical protein